MDDEVWKKRMAGNGNAVVVIWAGLSHVVDCNMLRSNGGRNDTFSKCGRACRCGSRSSISGVRPRSNQNWNMVVSLSLLDIELHLDLWPEAVDFLVFIPGSNLKLDAPRNFVALLETLQYRCWCLSVRRSFPLLDSAIIVCHGMERQRRLKRCPLAL